MEPELIHMWLYLCQFVTQLTDFAHLEVFHDAFLGYGIPNLKNLKLNFCDVITLELYSCQQNELIPC